MKHETGNLLLGLGIGAAMGLAIGYLMNPENRRKLANEVDHAVNKVKDEARNVYSKAKNKAEDVKDHVAENVNHTAEKVANKTQYDGRVSSETR